MVSSFLCIFALFALPSVLAISCYQCASQPPETMCTSGNINITDCDTLGLPKGLYDACIKISIETSMAEQTLTMNTMACTMKAMCEKAKKDGCNITNPGMTIKTCEASCCFEDKCNGITGGSGSGGNVLATTAPTSKGSSYVASFIATFMSVTALFAHFFIH